MEHRADGAERVAITQAVEALTGEIRSFAVRQLETATHETVDRLKEDAPAGALLAGAGVLGIFAVASGYRLSMRILGKLIGPGSAAFVGATAYGAGAAWLAGRALAVLRDAPSPIPVDTVRQSAAAIVDAAEAAATSDGRR